MLFVKYDKDVKLARQILFECLKIDELNVNHIDSLKATPLHVAMRERQIEALRDCVQLNKTYSRQIFNLNLINARG